MTSLKSKVLAIIVTLDNPRIAIKSLMSQTFIPAKIVVSNKVFDYKYVGERAGAATREAINGEDLNDFTHIFRTDGDVILHPRTLEVSLKLNADVVGCGGYSQLFRVSFLRSVFYGQYPISFAEDSVLAHAAIVLPKFSYKPAPYKPIFLNLRHYSKNVWFRCGIEYYMLGFSVLNLPFLFRNRRSATLVGFSSFFVVAGYLFGWARRVVPHFFVAGLRRNRFFVVDKKRRFFGESKFRFCCDVCGLPMRYDHFLYSTEGRIVFGCGKCGCVVSCPGGWFIENKT